MGQEYNDGVEVVVRWHRSSRILDAYSLAPLLNCVWLWTERAASLASHFDELKDCKGRPDNLDERQKQSRSRGANLVSLGRPVPETCKKP